MKKITVIICFMACILFTCLISRCKKEMLEIELTKNNLSLLDNLKLTKVYVFTSVIKKEGNAYSYEFPITPQKGEVIKVCIKDANQTAESAKQFTEEQIDRAKTYRLVFETTREVYSMRIYWDDQFVYGDWWESAYLFQVFKGWGLFDDLSRTDPDWPSRNALKKKEPTTQTPSSKE